MDKLHRPGRCRWWAAALVPIALPGCSGPGGAAALATDGSAEAAIVARWLGGEAGLARSDARLISSDFGVPLTVAALRELGPDADSTCRRTEVARSAHGARLAWACRRSWGDCPRHVDFTVLEDRIRSANTDEGMVALDQDGRQLPSAIPCSPDNRR